jgi:hypothetical protein
VYEKGGQLDERKGPDVADGLPEFLARWITF